MSDIDSFSTDEVEVDSSEHGPQGIQQDLVKELYRQIVEVANEGIWVIDTEGRTTYTNGRMAEMLGCTVQELMAKNAFNFVFPEDRPTAFREFDLRRMESRGRQIQFRYRKKDGSELWTIVNSSVITGAQGRVGAILGLFTDITELKRTQDELKALNRTLAHQVDTRTEKLKTAMQDLVRTQQELVNSEMKYRSLAENTRDILILMDDEGSIEYIGPQIKRYGLNQEDMVNRPLLDFVIEEDREHLCSELKRVRITKEIGILEFRLCAANGEFRSFEFSGAVRCEKKSGLTRITGVLRDISERKAAQHALRESEERRTELTAKLISAQDKEQRRISEVLHDQVLQLLAAAKMKHGLLATNREDLNKQRLYQELEGLLGQVIEKVRSLSFELKTSTLIRMGLTEAISELCAAMEARYGVHFDFETADKEFPIGAEASIVLFKGTRELLFNVVKHAGVKRSAVSMKRVAAQLMLTVKDEGRGFTAPESLQMDQGLGLFSIREWLRDVGGEMEIDSVPGSHTRIILSVPLEREHVNT
jgi:PAS domain S-box-containing protein